MFNNNLPDIILPDDKNIGSTPAPSLSSTISTQTPPSTSSATATAVSKSSNDAAYRDLKEIAFPNQIHRTFSDIVSKLGMYVCMYTIVLSSFLSIQDTRYCLSIMSIHL